MYLLAGPYLLFAAGVAVVLGALVVKLVAIKAAAWFFKMEREHKR